MTPAHVAQLTDTLIALFDPVVQAIDDMDSAEALLKDMGYQAPSGIAFLNDFSPALGALLDLADQTETLLRGGTDPDYLSLFRSLVEATRELVRLIRDIGTTLQTKFPAEFLAATNMVAQFPRQLADYLLVRMLERQYPVLHASLRLTGVVDEHEVTTAATPFNTAYTKRVIRWEHLGRFLSSPLASMQETYGWSTDGFDYDYLIANIRRFGQSVGFFPSLANPNPDALQALNGGADVVTDDNAGRLAVMKFPLLPVLDAKIGTEIYPVLNATKDKVAGLGLGLYFDPSAGPTFSITDELSLGIKYAGTSPLDAGVVILPGQPLRQVNNIFGGSGAATDLTKFVPEFTYANADQKILLFESAVGAKLEFTAWALRAGLLPDPGGLYIETDLKGATLTLSASQADGFLKEILPAQPMTLDFDLTVGFSSRSGLYFGGSVGLDVTLPTVARVGPIVLQGTTVALKPANDKIPLTFGTDISASVGPFSVVVQNMGTAVTLSFPSSGGNLGVADLDFGFKPPSGIGLSIDTQGVISGGGFLFHDPGQGLYAGVMKLSLADAFTVTAFGLIATRMPDGSPGYSLIVFVTAEDFRPIPLGMGFTLQGIGGMVAINRTFDQDVLRAGMQNDTLKTLLFPRDPVTNAATIIRSLAAAFPARRGSYLLGILARIGWFTPTLITLDLALILEFGARRRLLVLGRVSALLPSPDNDLVRINLDSIGVLDFDQDTASIDAILVDSRLARKFVLTGAAALRAGWGSGPHQGFVLAVGGFNPHFAPPAGVPPLARVAIALCSGNNPRLTCEAYFAITANTIQFGANASLYAEAYSFSISGDIGYDVLITRTPLHFIADYHASVQLKYGSHNLFKVSVEGSLEGPRPLRVSGKATFEIFWCDFSVRFDKTLVDGEAPPPPPAVDVLAELNRALATAQSWSTQAPANQSHGVALRKLAPGTALVLDPLGRLAIKQDVVPLDTGRDIDVFGGAPVSGAKRFAIAAVLNNIDLTQVTMLQAPFAPAQFFNMSDDDKIAAPSFTQMDAGLVVGNDDAVAIDAAQLVAAPLEYDSIIIDTLTADVPPRQPAPYVLPLGQLAVHAATGAAARAPVRNVGRARFRTPGLPAVAIAEPTWAIAPLDGGPAVAVAPAIKTWTDYQGTLTALNRTAARFQLVPAAALAA